MVNGIIVRNLIPRCYFITSGAGESDITIHAGSYHMALEDAGIAGCNIVRYSSIIPNEAREVKKPKLVHGAELKVIEARADARKGKLATAGICYGWLYDKNNRRFGGIVTEYLGNSSHGDAENELERGLEEIARASFRDKELRDVKMLIKSFEPSKRYGTALVSICFVDFILPVSGESKMAIKR